jgi:hypothetical protein
VTKGHGGPGGSWKQRESELFLFQGILKLPEPVGEERPGQFLITNNRQVGRGLGGSPTRVWLSLGSGGGSL